jgi:hypothetical protein
VIATATGTRTPTPAPAPALSGPPDGQEFGRKQPMALQWSWNGTLRQDTYFVVIVQYPHDGAVWKDIHWVKETSFVPPAYLADLITGDRRCQWTVTVMRQTGMGADGLRTGEPISQPSTGRTFVWRAD